MAPYEGTCHCGVVSWTAEIPEELQGHILCHCGACKMQSGGEFTLNQIIPKANFKLTQGDLKVYTYRGDSGEATDCFFCGNCTCSPYHHQHVQGEDKIVLRTGLLRGTEKWGKPPAEVYVKERLNWMPQMADTAFDTVPPS